MKFGHFQIEAKKMFNNKWYRLFESGSVGWQLLKSFLMELVSVVEPIFVIVWQAYTNTTLHTYTVTNNT